MSFAAFGHQCDSVARIPSDLRIAAARMGLDEVLADPPPPDVDLTVIFRGREGFAEVTIAQCIDEAQDGDERGWYETDPTEAGRGAEARLHRAEGGRVVDVRIRMDGCGGEMALDAARSLCSASLR